MPASSKHQVFRYAPEEARTEIQTNKFIPWVTSESSSYPDGETNPVRTWTLVTRSSLHGQRETLSIRSTLARQKKAKVKGNCIVRREACSFLYKSLTRKVRLLIDN